MSYDDVSIKTDDGETLHGWIIPHENARSTLLYFHGNAGNIADRVESIQLLNSIGLNIFIIDYRGYGQSTGTPSERGTYRDARAAWDFLTSAQNIPAENIVIYGRSLGGAIAVDLAMHTNPAALILGSTFTRAKDMAKNLIPYVPTGFLLSIRYNSLRKIKKILCPVLITHSKEDDLIPFSMGKRLYQEAREPKRFVELHGGHNDNIYVSREKYLSALDKFLSDYVDIEA
jgi:hypothetical protein